MYRVLPEGDAFIGVGGGNAATDYVAFAELTGSGIGHVTSAPRTPPQGLSPRLPAQPAVAGRLTPGTASYQLIVDESNEGVLDADVAAKGGLSRYLREEFGFAMKVHDQDAGTQIAITAATKTATLTARTGGADPGDVGVVLGTTLQPATVIDVGLILVLDGVAYGVGRWVDASSSFRVYRIGAVAGTLVTPDAVALADVAATDEWELHEWAIRYDYQGVVTQGPGHEVGTDSITKSITVQLRDFEVKRFVLGA